MQLTSTAFTNNGPIPSEYGCRGKGISPPLAITGVAPNSQSLALIVDDPDAPGGTFYHWLVWNIPANISHIPPAWQESAGVMLGTNGFGKPAWGGPCPPSGVHHYHFKLYALNARLSLPSGSDSQQLRKAMNGHVIEAAELVGTYSQN